MRPAILPALLAVVVLAGSPARATYTFVTTPAALGATEVIDWGQLGADGATAASPVGVVSSRGLTATVATTDPAGLLRLNEGEGWLGNFTPGDRLLTNNSFNYAPLTLTFSRPVAAVGANLQRELYGAFTGTLRVFEGSTVVASYTLAGLSNDNADGSAIFLGVRSTANSITRIEFGLANPPTVPPSDFAINGVRLAVIPEPPGAALLAVGAALLAARRLRRRPAGA